mmetsp:Transcript_12011/g.18251  ORF Transcript_12011/g.18251 Transcript_12011/m.18251 type:complete len:245 (-) Transcript_12011:432-1166(-)
MDNCVGCCHQGGPPGPLKYWNCIWDEKELGIERDFEIRGMEKRRLLRLRPDYKDEGGWFPTSRVEYMTIVAREVLRDGNAEIVGGFIRDWIIRGEVDIENGTPKDIDVRLWQNFGMKAFEKRCLSWGLKRDYSHGLFGFKTPTGEYFFIDYVFTDKGGGTNLTIDLDVNSFAVSADKGLHKRAYHQRPICKTYGNMKRKVAYLIENNPPDGMCEYMKKRVEKMEKRGWRVLRAPSLQKNCGCKN